MTEPLETESVASASPTVKRVALAREGKGVIQLVQPIKKRRVAEEVADRVRGMILEGAFPAAQPLPAERDLAERFGVSRGAVRDALRMLEMIGLIETRHGQGTFPQELNVDRLVAPLTAVMAYRPDMRDELMDVRRMFEPAVARAAATRATEEDFADLEHVIEAQRVKLASGQSPIAEDTAFHALLARATQNRVVVSIMAILNDLLMESRKMALSHRGRPQQSLQGHEAVIAALRRRDAAGAAQAMHEHIKQIADLQMQAQETSSGDTATSSDSDNSET